MFQFKQFSVDQTNCAMKINTDGVLLGALAQAETVDNVLDIGTGTGVIALMLAQRFPNAKIDAVEIDELAAVTANGNFSRSVFSSRLKAYAVGFEEFFERDPDKKYDLIVSNPPFYINSLLSMEDKKQLAKHADKNFFKEMLQCVVRHLTVNGACWVILPLDTADLVKTLAAKLGLNVSMIIHLRSFKEKAPHRELMLVKHVGCILIEDEFIIYEAEGIHSNQYRNALKEFFTIF